MLLASLLLAGAALAAPANPPSFDSDALARELTAVDLRLMQAVEQALSTPFEVPKVPQIKAAVDEINTSGVGATSVLGTLLGSTQTPLAALNAFTVGSDAVDRRAAEAAEEQRRLEQRAAKLRAAWNEACRGADEKKKTRCDKAEGAVNSADDAVRQGENPLKELSELRGSIGESVRLTRREREELESDAAKIERANAPIGAAAQELKSKLDGLGAAPENESRTRAFRAQDDLLDPARRVHALVAPALDHARRFDQRYRAFRGDAIRFNDAATALKARHSEADSRLSAAETAVADAAR